MKLTPVRRNIGIAFAAVLLAPAVCAAEGDAGSARGIPTSQFGVYVHQGEWLVYPGFEYYRDHNFEYDPNEFGFASPSEFKGRYRASEEVLFLAYGLSDRLAWELEGDAISASLRKAAEDRSGLPAEVRESGLGNVRTRLTWRWAEERGRRPELFSYSDVFFPHDKKKVLTGTPGWVFDAGIGAARDFHWGTLTLRGGILFEEASASATDWGEVALEYLKRVSPRLTVFSSLLVREGDEVSLIAEVQWQVSPHVVLRLNNGLGLTPHGYDLEPEAGILFRFPR